MAIPVPVSYTKIATATWGIPITNEVNRLTTQSDGNVTRIAALESKTTPTAWTALSYVNGWVNAYPTTPGKYRKIGDLVYVQGMISSGAINAAIATLPVGYRSPTELNIWQGTWDGGKWTAAMLYVGTNGELVYKGGTVSPAIWFTINCVYATV